MPIAKGQRQVLPTGEVGEVKINPGLYNNEAGALSGLAGSVSRLGIANFEEGQRINSIQATKETTDGILAYETDFRDKIVELNKDPDYAGRGKKFDDWHKKTTTEIMADKKNPRAIKDLQIEFKRLQNSHGMQIEFAADRSIIQDERAAIPAKTSIFADNFVAANSEQEKKIQLNRAVAYLKQLHIDGVLSKNELETQMLNLDNTFVKAIQNKLKTSIEVDAFAIAAKDGYPAAEKMLRDPVVRENLIAGGMKREDAAALLRDIEDNVKDARAGEQEALRQNRQALGNEVFKAITEKRYADARTLINSGKDGVAFEATGENSKTSWTSLLDGAKTKGGETELNEKTWDVYWNTLKKVTNNPDSIKEGELEAMVGKGISIGDYKEFQGILGKNKESDILKNEGVVNGLKTIYGLRSAGSFVGLKPSDMETVDKLANEKAWRTVTQEFTRWAEANADKVNDPVWDEMVSEKIQKLTQPFEQKAQLSSFVSFFRPGGRDKAKLEKLRNEQLAEAVGDTGGGVKTVDSEAVSKYYDLANGDEAEVKRLMKKDGYTIED